MLGGSVFKSVKNGSRGDQVKSRPIQTTDRCLEARFTTEK